MWLGTCFLSSPNNMGAVSLANKPCSTCVDFLTGAMIAASTALRLLTIIRECQISPKGIGTAQRLLANIVAESTSEPSPYSEHIRMQDKIEHQKLQMHSWIKK